MRMRPEARKAMIMFVGLLLFLGPSVVQVAAQEDVLSCLDCHEVDESFNMNPHVRGRIVDGVIPNAVCEGCHGSGTEHIEAGGDAALITLPAGLDGSNVCLSCHDKPDFWSSKANSVHRNTETVNCLTCHEIHMPEPSEAKLLRKKKLELCSSCHSTKAASLANKPFGHRIGRGGMECTSCHNPHGLRSTGTLARTKAGEIACLECHTDKRGPYVFGHGSREIRDCRGCHELHGSNNPRQLKRANVYQLCIECHSPLTGTTVGSQPPAFHDLTDPRYQNCTTCHVAIHGSNRSPRLLK